MKYLRRGRLVVNEVDYCMLYPRIVPFFFAKVYHQYIGHQWQSEPKFEISKFPFFFFIFVMFGAGAAKRFELWECMYSSVVCIVYDRP